MGSSGRPWAGFHVFCYFWVDFINSGGSLSPKGEALGLSLSEGSKSGTPPLPTDPSVRRPRARRALPALQGLFDFLHAGLGPQAPLGSRCSASKLVEPKRRGGSTCGGTRGYDSPPSEMRHHRNGKPPNPHLAGLRMCFERSKKKATKACGINP